MIMNEIDKEILELLLNGASISTMQKKTGLSPSGLVKHLNKLKDQGYLIKKIYEEKGVSYGIDKNYINNNNDIIDISVEHCFKFLAISDTHITSNNKRINNLNKLYEYANIRKIPYVLHMGDMIEGAEPNEKLGGEGDIFNQINYLTASYPKYDDITTMFILGNHDIRSINQKGIDISRVIENRRMDMHFMGYNYGIIKVNNRFIALHHPNHFELDKYNDELEDNVKVKPDIILCGHLHKKQIINIDNQLNIYVPQTYNISNNIAGAYEIQLAPSDDYDKYNLNLIDIKPLLITDKVIPYMEISEQFTNKETPKVKKYENMSQVDKFNNKYKR